MALILIADDDELVIELVRDALSPRGHVVAAVDDRAMVVPAVESVCPDLVILDIAMPELSGVEALRQIRYSQISHGTPVLMLTACRSEADEEIAIRAGANDYLRKPFDPYQLAARVDLLLMRADIGGPPAPQPHSEQR